MRRRRQQLAFLALLTLAIVGPAASVRAQVPPAAPEQPPGTHKHDGFFARVRMGGGSLQTATTPSASGPVARRFAGSKAAMSMTLSFGGAIVENLILFGEVNQSLSLDGGSIEEMNPETSGNLWFALVPAGGVSYYLPWQNVYLSASFGLAHLSSESLFAETINSSAGWGASLVAGKEWWIWRDLGVGLAAEIRHARVRIPDEALMPDRQRCSATGFYLSASATYNGGPAPSRRRDCCRFKLEAPGEISRTSCGIRSPPPLDDQTLRDVGSQLPVDRGAISATRASSRSGSRGFFSTRWRGAG